MHNSLETGVAEAVSAIARLRETAGFVPDLLRRQQAVPRLIDAELGLAHAVLEAEDGLARPLRARIARGVAEDLGSPYCETIYRGRLHAIGDPARGAADAARDHDVVRVARRLGRLEADRDELERLPFARPSDRHLVEVVVLTAFVRFQCALATGLGAVPDAVPYGDTARRLPDSAHEARAAGAPAPHAVATFPPLAMITRAFGFTPNLLLAQMARPDLVAAEVDVLRAILLTGDVLTRVQKERIVLVVTAAARNSYCVAAHCELLRGHGIPLDHAEQVAVDHRRAGLSPADVALLDAMLALAVRPEAYRADEAHERLRDHGFTEAHIVEAIATCGLGQFLNVASLGLGVEPQFELPPSFRRGRAVAPDGGPRAIAHAGRDSGTPPVEDPDAALVQRAQAGDEDAFADLVRRHGTRITRTLTGLLGRTGDVEDAMQDTFLKAFRHIGAFRGRSRFSTWLTRIAINTGLRRLRGYRKLESLDDRPGAAEEYRPLDVRPWQEDPERLYSREILRQLVHEALQQIPLKYRLVVMLRDLDQLSTAETGAVLGLGVPAVKARLFRGRLMLRDVLAPHFAKAEDPTTHA